MPSLTAIRRSSLLLSICVLGALRAVGGAAEAPFAHVQTDRAAYRIGDTIWLRVHGDVDTSSRVRLVDPHGVIVDEADLRASADGLAAASLYVPVEAHGGRFAVEALVGDAVAHRSALEVYDLESPELRLEIELIGDIAHPGGTLTAVFSAADRRGRPVPGAPIESLLTLGSSSLRETLGSTGSDGRATVRVPIPEDADSDGFLALGVATRAGTAAVATPVDLAFSVGTIECVPEGGAIVTGHPQRVGLRVRDHRSAPTAAEGRVLDDRGRCVDSFRAAPSGLASVIVPYEPGRAYRVVIDRPRGVEHEFPLPGATGHRHSIAVERVDDALLVAVRGDASTRGETLDIGFTSTSRSGRRQRVRLVPPRPSSEGSTSSLPIAHARLELPRGIDLGSVVVSRAGRAVLRRPVALNIRRPVSVEWSPVGGARLLPRRPVEIDVRTTLDGRPVAADLAVSLHRGRVAALPDLVVRRRLAAETGRILAPPPGLFAADGDGEEREAYLLVEAGFAYDDEGVPLAKDGRPSDEIGHLAPRRVDAPVTTSTRAPRTEATVASEHGSDPPKPIREPRGRTVASKGRIERLLVRAAYTRPVSPLDPPAHSVELAVPEERLVTPLVERRGRARRPQETRVPSSSVDARFGLFWNERIRTDARGRARVRIVPGDLVGGLSWHAAGTAGDVPVDARGALAIDPGFAFDLTLPEHIHVGDSFDVMVSGRAEEALGGKVRVELVRPDSFTPLLRTTLDFDPRLDARLQRFALRATRVDPEAELRLVARRGAYVETRHHRVPILPRDVEVRRGTTGRALGRQDLALSVPKEAVPGSVRASASVLVSAPAAAVESFESLLRVPTGCFEQFSSKSITNLAVLQSLLEHADGDPELLSRAWRFAESGLARLLEHHDPASGGFVMFPGQKPSAHATTVAVRLLAPYSRLLEGKGVRELERAIRWLERHPESDRKALLHTTLALHDGGRLWGPSSQLLAVDPRDRYEAALIAACLALWPEDSERREADVDGGSRHLRADRVRHLLERTQRPGRRDENGLLGSRGARLEVEVLALSTIAAHRAGIEEQVEPLADRLLELHSRSVGTLSSTLAIRAFGPVLSAFHGQQVGLAFAPDGAATDRLQTLTGSGVPLCFDRVLDVAPGGTARASLEIDAPRRLPYRLDLAWRVERPESSPRAPYRLTTWITPSAFSDQRVDLRVQVDPEPGLVAATRGQVVARIGLPAGLELDVESLGELILDGALSHWESADGWLDLYWATPPREHRSIDVEAIARVPGEFAARPSSIAPYYESGCESWAPPLRLRVHNAFGNSTSLEEAARRGAAPPHPGVVRPGGFSF